MRCRYCVVIDGPRGGSESLSQESSSRAVGRGDVPGIADPELRHGLCHDNEKLRTSARD